MRRTAAGARELLRHAVVWICAGALLGCSDNIRNTDSGVLTPDATLRGSTPDSATPDGAAPDSAAPDSAAPDSTPGDAPSSDAESIDLAPSSDTGAADAQPDLSADLSTAADAAECSPGCSGDQVCLGEVCGCIKALHGDTYLRTDGTVVNYGAVNLPRVIETGPGQPLDRIVAIYDGRWHGCALRAGEASQTVWCWPKAANGNNAGQLGNGVVDGSVTPWRATQVLRASGDTTAPLTGVVAINGGSSRCYLASAMCAVLQDQTLWCWGSPNSSGGGGGDLFNDGISGNRPLAVPILAAAATPLAGVDAVSLGTRHACALRSGEVWCWGANVGGPLGQGDQDPRPYPTKVALPGLAQQLGAGADATCARVADAVYCWGSNNSGQIGIGTPKDTTDGCINFCKLTPARVLTDDAALGSVVDLNVAYLGVCARRADHSLWCWGASVGDTARPLTLVTVSGDLTVDDVALHSSCSSTPLTKSIRYLTRTNELRNSAGVINQTCPD